MADLIAYQSGDWTGATTWKGVATSTGAKQTSTTNATGVSSSYVYSPTFTITNGVVIEGLLLHCRRGGITSSGTMTVALSDDNGVTATREVTVDAQDIPRGLTASWVFFKFGTPLTGDGGTDYRIGVKGTVNNNVLFSRSATTADWARYLRTDATATIGASDRTFIAGELTAPGTVNALTVTMDSTASTAYGDLDICYNGTLSYGTSASTNYILDLAGTLNIWDGGILNIGTSGTRIPSTSTALLEFTNAVNVDRGLEVRGGGTVNLYGATKTTIQTLLTADASSGQKVVTVGSTSGWLANDVIALASTTRTPGQSEKATISTVDSGTQITTVANLTNTHHGVSPYQGEVVNLTRNVKIRGTSQSLCAYVNCEATSNFTAEYAEFFFLGSSTAFKQGIDSATSSAGTFSMKFCSMYDYNSTGSANLIRAAGTTASIVIEDCVFYVSNTSQTPFSITATSGTPSIQRNWWVSVGTTNASFGDVGGTIQDNRFGGCGFILGEFGGNIGTIKDNIIHSTIQYSLLITNPLYGTIDGMVIWRCAGYAVRIDAGGWIGLNWNLYHNANGINPFSNGGSFVFRDSDFNGGSGASLSQTGIHMNFSRNFQALFENCNFGNVQTASTACITVSAYPGYEVIFRNCFIGESTVVQNQSNLTSSDYLTSYIGFDKFNNTAGSHRAYKQFGRTESDQSTFNTAAPSEALLPNNASNKLPSGSKKLAVASGQTATVNVYVRKSATYNGNQPRLIVKANSIAGITTDTVLDTMSVGTESWEQLSGTTATVSDDCVLEVYVDCDGTAGTVNVDDWSVS